MSGSREQVCICSAEERKRKWRRLGDGGQCKRTCQSMASCSFTQRGSSREVIVVPGRPIVWGQTARDGRLPLLVLCSQEDLVAAIGMDAI